MINLSETYIYEGSENWQTGNRVTAQRKIKTGDTVTLKFLGASEENIRVETYNGLWDVYDKIPAIGENYYFEVLVNDKRTYYGKYATSRYTEASVGTGGVQYGDNHDCIDEQQVNRAFAQFKKWLRDGAKNNNYWHGLYLKKDFPETISYCMPGEVVEPLVVTANGLTEGEEFSVGLFNYKVLSANDATASVTGPSGELPEILSIPERISWNGFDLTVTEIGSGSFEKCDSLKEIIIPAAVASIGKDAFSRCENVRRITSMAEKPPVLGDPEDESISDPFRWIDRCDCILFVPERSVDKYRSTRKTVRGWRHFFKILPIGGRLDAAPTESLPVFDKTWKKVSFIDGKPRPKLEGIQKVWIEEGTETLPDGLFSFLEDLHSVYIPSSVRKMGKESFYHCRNLENIYFEDPSAIRFDSLEEMFAESRRISDWSFLKKWNTKGVRSMAEMFENCAGLKDLTPMADWDTADVEDISKMFIRCEAIADLSPLSNWNVSAVKNASALFCNSGITGVKALASWDTSSFEDISFIFCGCDNLASLDGIGSWNTSKVSNMKGAFSGCKSLKDFRVLASWKTGNVKDISKMFARGDEGAAPLFPDFSAWDTGLVENMENFFEDRKDIKDLNCLAGMDVSNVRTIGHAFSGCICLSDISGLSTWSVSRIDNMRGLFADCISLQDLGPLANWDVSGCQSPDYMFDSCSGLTDLSALKNWDWKSAKGLDFMFAGCTQLSDISALASWEIRRMEDLRGLFYECARLADISALSSWDVSNVSNVSRLFKGCEKLEDLTPLKDWDTCLMMDFESMFAECKSLVDVSPIAHWNMKRKEKRFNDLFKGCSKLTEVGCLDWRYGSAYISGMFAECGESKFQMESDYKAQKEPVEEQIQLIGSFEIKESADGVLEFKSGRISFAMIPVEGGTYTMGYKSDKPDYRYSYENMAREETVNDFYIGQTQVTQALWEAVMGCNPSLIPGPKLPVEWVSPAECMEFIKKLNKLTGLHFTLPTQAEWEYAARGGKLSRGYQFAGGDIIDEVAWHCGNTNHMEHPVGLKKPNELGLYDMTGNVREICLDKDKRYTDCHITRGGSFVDSAEKWCKITYYDYTSNKSNCVGLRLAFHK